ncbi:MAG TPA: superinfection immunity protein, partial [Puia sp.]|nr:superinfection immunity protein [Puia sp.]
MFHHHLFPFLPGVLGWTIIVVCLVPYFLPTIIAMMRSNPNVGGIFAVNFLLGWTFIGWVACLIWSLSETRTTVIVNNSQPYTPSPDYSSSMTGAPPQ